MRARGAYTKINHAKLKTTFKIVFFIYKANYKLLTIKEYDQYSSFQNYIPTVLAKDKREVFSFCFRFKKIIDVDDPFIRRTQAAVCNSLWKI